VDETEEYQAAVEAGKIKKAKAEESAEPEKEEFPEPTSAEQVSGESAPQQEVDSEISAGQPEEVAESAKPDEQFEVSERQEEEPAVSKEDEITTEDRSEEEPVQADEAEKEEPVEEPEPIDSFEPIPEEEVPEEEEDEGPKIPAFMFRESEEDEEVIIETDLPEAVESDDQFIQDSETESETEEEEFAGEVIPAESLESQEPEYAGEKPKDADEGAAPEWEQRARDRARSRDAGKSGEEDMPWLYPEKKKSKNWLPTILIVLLLIGIAGAAYYLMVDRPEFLTNREAQPFDEPLIDVDQTSPEGVTVEDEASDLPEQNEPDAGERASVSSEDVPEPDPATPIARSISTPENVYPYDFGADGSREFMETYTQGLSLFEEGNYREAERVFQRLQISDPPDDYADNTQYWIGECKFGMRQYRESIRAFEEVFIYPNTNKVDDSLIMMASAYIHLNEMQEAAEILRKFQDQYSNSQYAPIAQRWINRYNL
jgi:TolA-binding protein